MSFFESGNTHAPLEWPALWAQELIVHGHTPAAHALLHEVIRRYHDLPAERRMMVLNRLAYARMLVLLE
ncbi:hypothetical protein BH23GEM3_BH23GEM3_00450 [soil metagenome]